MSEARAEADLTLGRIVAEFDGDELVPGQLEHGQAAQGVSGTLSADVGGRGILEEVFLDRVLAEPGDSAQPPGDGRAGPALEFEFPCEAFDVGAAGGEQGERAGRAPRGERTQGPGAAPSAPT